MLLNNKHIIIAEFNAAAIQNVFEFTDELRIAKRHYSGNEVFKDGQSIFLQCVYGKVEQNNAGIMLGSMIANINEEFTFTISLDSCNKHNPSAIIFQKIQVTLPLSHPFHIRGRVSFQF